jgi:hypothetical protein
MSAMMREILTARLRSAAMHLGSLLGDVVFIGGAVIPLLMTDRGARDVRSTDDIDVVISLTSKVEWYALQDQLKTLGFKPGGGSAPLCRFVKDDLILDIVPTEASVLGFCIDGTGAQ